MLSYVGLASSLFGGLADKYSKTFSAVKTNLLRADIKLPLRSFVSVAFLSSLIVFFLSFSPLFLLFYFIEVPFLIKILSFVLTPTLNAIICFLIFMLYPIHKASGRVKGIETNLPFALTHMGAIAESGIPPYIIFKLISEFEEYGEISKEMKKVVRNIEAFGMDPLSAVKEVAERTPSEKFKQVLLGFITTTEAGGNVKLYLKNAGEQAMFEWRIKREKFLQQLSAFAEFYTGILIAAPLFIIALFAVMNMIQPTIAGFDILDLTKISVYAIVPIVNAGFLLFLRGIEVEM